MKLLTKAELPKAIESIQRRGVALDNDIHVAACSALALLADHNDTTWVNRLYLALAKGTRKQALTSWLLTYGALIANVGDNKAEQPFSFTKDKPSRLSEGQADPWFDHKPDPKPDEVFDIMAAVQAVLKKAKGTKAELKHAELLAPLAAMVEAGALSSSMVNAASSNSRSEGTDDAEETTAGVPAALLSGTDVLNAVAATSH